MRRQNCHRTQVGRSRGLGCSRAGNLEVKPVAEQGDQTWLRADGQQAIGQTFQLRPSAGDDVFYAGAPLP